MSDAVNAKGAKIGKLFQTTTGGRPFMFRIVEGR